MNTTRHRGPNRPQSVEERDWLAQERALSPGGGDRGDALLARALETLPASSPPPGFAADMARLVTPDAAVQRDEGRLERVLLNGLFVAMALGAVVATFLYGGHWLALSKHALGGDASAWALAGAACLALSWALGRAQRRWVPRVAAT